MLLKQNNSPQNKLLQDAKNYLKYLLKIYLMKKNGIKYNHFTIIKKGKKQLIFYTQSVIHK